MVRYFEKLLYSVRNPICFYIHCIPYIYMVYYPMHFFLRTILFTIPYHFQGGGGGEDVLIIHNYVALLSVRYTVPGTAGQSL